MSLISSFIRNQLLKAVQEEYENHSDELKQKLVEEIQAFSEEALSWVESKLNKDES